MWQAGWHFTQWHHITPFLLSLSLLFRVFVIICSPFISTSYFAISTSFCLLCHFISNSFASTLPCVSWLCWKGWETQTASGDFLNESLCACVCVFCVRTCTLWSVFSCYSDIFLSFFYNNILLQLLRCDRIFSLTEYPEYLIACIAVKSEKLCCLSSCQILHLVGDHYRNPPSYLSPLFITTAEKCCISSAMNTALCLWLPVQIVEVL